MNIRIKELKEQALKECLDKSDSLVEGETITLREFHDLVEQRFVELVLQEFAYDCMDATGNSKMVEWVAKRWEINV